MTKFVPSTLAEIERFLSAKNEPPKKIETNMTWVQLFDKSKKRRNQAVKIKN